MFRCPVLQKEKTKLDKEPELLFCIFLHLLAKVFKNIYSFYNTGVDL